MTINDILIALFAALPPTILAFAALITSIKNGTKLNEVHLSLNSRLSELVAASNAQGRIDERNQTAAPDVSNAVIAKDGEVFKPTTVFTPTKKTTKT